MAYALDRLARVAAARGQEDLCRRHVARGLELVERHRVEPGRVYLRATLGLLELGLGRIPAALAQLEAAQGFSRRHGVAEPRVLQWQADLVEAQVRVGDHEAAALGVEELARAGRRSGGRWTLGAAARGRGLLAPAGEAGACFDVALGHFEALPAPFEEARTQLCRGEWLRRAGQRTEARRALGAAVDGFERLGAAPWVARGRRELDATGATSRRRADREDRDALTAHELQVASVVAAGATNREAAAVLFLSPKTVEFHLSHIYRKLGVRSRAELAARAAREEGLARRGGDGSRRE
jgi:DNA-binding CsgD family transcriptional regulator